MLDLADESLCHCCKTVAVFKETDQGYWCEGCEDYHFSMHPLMANDYRLPIQIEMF